MTRIDTKQIMADIRANRERLAGCRVHRFPCGTPDRIMGKPWACEHCGGTMDATAVLAYCAGFAAAGGDPQAVWPDHEAVQTRMTKAFDQL